MFSHFYEDDYHHLLLVMCDFADWLFHFLDTKLYWHSFTQGWSKVSFISSVFPPVFDSVSSNSLENPAFKCYTARLQLAASLCLHVQVFYELMLPRAAFRLQTILIFPLYSSWLRERSGTFWHRSSHPRKVGWAWALGPTPRASQRWAAIHRDWLRTTSSAGSEGPWTLLTCRGPPTLAPAWRTDTDRQTHAWTNRQTDGRIQESDTRTQR